MKGTTAGLGARVSPAPADAAPIYVDLDDVLADSTRSYLSILEREFGRRVAFADIHSFDLRVSFGLDELEFDHFFELIHRPSEMLHFPPVAGACAVLAGWALAGWQIEVVTGRHPNTRDASLQWLEQHAIPCRRLRMVDKYGRNGSAPGALSLVELASLSFAFAVEDAAPTSHHLARVMGVPVALYERPWNRGASPVPGVTPCADWGAVARHHGAVCAAALGGEPCSAPW